MAENAHLLSKIERRQDTFSKIHMELTFDTFYRAVVLAIAEMLLHMRLLTFPSRSVETVPDATHCDTCVAATNSSSLPSKSEQRSGISWTPLDISASTVWLAAKIA